MNRIIENIRIVMVATTHPGNIGAAARAMKTMGHNRLYLVNPKIYPSADSTARAAGADDVLAKVTVCESLDSALKNCNLVVGTSARSRSISWPVYGPRECAGKVVEIAKSGEVAIVFGRESSGLSNEELERCNAMVQIPANPEFNSLNIASAIQILCYEILQSILEDDSEIKDKEEEFPLATIDQMNLFYDHLQQCMIDIGFYDPEKPRRLMRRLKRLFNRTQMDENEMNIMRGILAAMQEAIKK